MNSLHNDEKGFTLVELILALALVSMVLSGFMAVYWFGSKAFAMENNSSIMQHESRVCRDAIESDVCVAESIWIYRSKGGTEISSSADSGGCLRVLKSEVNGSSTDFTEVYYYVNNNQCYRERWDLNVYLSSTDDVLIDNTPIAENITSLEFVKPVPGLVEFTINAGIDGDAFSLEGRCRSRVDYGMSNLEG